MGARVPARDDRTQDEAVISAIFGCQSSAGRTRFHMFGEAFAEGGGIAANWPCAQPLSSRVTEQVHARSPDLIEGTTLSAGEARDDDRPLMAVVNDEIQRLHGSLGLFDSEFFCECGHIICKERVTLSRDEFATLRAQSRRLIAPAHVNVGEAPDHQTLAVLADAAAVVEAGAKIGIASHVAAFH